MIYSIWIALRLCRKFRLKSNGSSANAAPTNFLFVVFVFRTFDANRSVSTFVQYLQYTYSSLFASMACVLGILFTFPTWALFRQRACTYLGHMPHWAQKRKSNQGNCTWKFEESQPKAIFFITMRKFIVDQCYSRWIDLFLFWRWMQSRDWNSIWQSQLLSLGVTLFSCHWLLNNAISWNIVDAAHMEQ